MENPTQVTMTLVFDVEEGTTIRELQDILTTLQACPQDIDVMFADSACDIQLDPRPTVTSS